MTVALVKENVDLRAAFDVRSIVFIDEQQVDRDEEFDQFENESYHFLARDDKGIACGAARWRFTENGVKLERFAVLKSHRGKGVGSALVEAVLEHIAQLKSAAGKTLYLHAQLDAMPLYEKFGFIADGEIFYECEIPHRLMTRS
ncbi:MAG: GNAT family N-acetyltransferase [Bacteroidota bacterium]